MGMPLNRQRGRVRAPRGRARENRKFIQAPSPEIWSETISGGEKVLAGKWGGLFLGYLLISKRKPSRRSIFPRHDDHLLHPRRATARGRPGGGGDRVRRQFGRTGLASRGCYRAVRAQAARRRRPASLASVLPHSRLRFGAVPATVTASGM